MRKDAWIIAIIFLSSAATGLGVSAAEHGGQSGDEKAGRAAGGTAKDGEEAPPDRKNRASARRPRLRWASTPSGSPSSPCRMTGCEKALSVRSRVGALAPGHHLYLVVRGLRAEAPPGVLYDVYLDLPADPSRDMCRAHKVGVLNFFNAVGQGQPDKKAKNDRFISFDVTDVAKRLHSKGRLRPKPILTIIPAGKPAAEAKPVIGEITLVEM